MHTTTTHFGGGSALDDFRRAMKEFGETGPLLGAVLAVEWWAHGGTTLEFEPGTMDDAGWRLAEDLLGSEGVEVMKRHMRHKVIAVPARDLDSLPVTKGDGSSALFGPRVYRLRNSPALNVLADEPDPPE